MSELQQLLDQLVAAGAPGAAGWARDERGSLGAASGLANRWTRQPMRPELRSRAGSIPGFLSIVLSPPDGRRQLSLMINALPAPAPVYEAFIQGSRALGSRLLR